MFKETIKNKKYIWENEEVKIEFSNGSFQGFDEYAYVKSTKDIMYLYYTMAIYKRINNGWKMIGITNTHDFPHILDFIAIAKFMLNEMDNTIPLDDYQKIKNNRGKYTLYSYSMETDDFSHDDFYRITKNIRKHSGEPDTLYYDMYIGTQLDVDSGTTTSGINLSFVKEEELKSLLQTAEDFMNHIIKKTNKNIRNRNIEEMNSYETYKGKLYKNNKSSIEEVYTGDEKDISITCLCGDINTNDYSSIYYEHTNITGIENGNIKIVGGYSTNRSGKTTKIDKPITINPSTVLFISKDIPEEQLKYNEEEIADDFWSILDEEEKEDFANLSKEELFTKWGNAIINRTWMCRGEHLYKVKRKENVYGVESVADNVKKVIEILEKK